MELTLGMILALGAVMFASALMQGVTGFGFGLIAMGILPLFLPIELVSMAVSLVLIPLLILNLTAHHRHFSWPHARLLCLGTLLGVAPGIFLLVAADGLLLKRILGGILIITALHSALSNKPPAWIHGGKAGFGAGLLCGTLGGAFNTGGPPVVYYIYNQPWPLPQAIATLQFLFLTTALSKLMLGSGLGLVNRPVITVTLLSLIPMAGGLALGIVLSKRVPAKPIRRITFLLLGVLGLYYLAGIS